MAKNPDLHTWVAAGFSPLDADWHHAAGVSLDQAMSWRAHNIDGYNTFMFRQADADTPAAAKAWLAEHYDAEDAHLFTKAYRAAGHSGGPAQVRAWAAAWVAANYDSADTLHACEHGYVTVELAQAAARAAFQDPYTRGAGQLPADVDDMDTLARRWMQRHPRKHTAATGRPVAAPHIAPRDRHRPAHSR